MTINLSNAYFQNNEISIICAHDHLGFCIVIEMDNGVSINFEVETKAELKDRICFFIKYYGYATSILIQEFNVKNWS